MLALPDNQADAAFDEIKLLPGREDRFQKWRLDKNGPPDESFANFQTHLRSSLSLELEVLL